MNNTKNLGWCQVTYRYKDVEQMFCTTGPMGHLPINQPRVTLVTRTISGFVQLQDDSRWIRVLYLEEEDLSQGHPQWLHMDDVSDISEVHDLDPSLDSPFESTWDAFRPLNWTQV